MSKWKDINNIMPDLLVSNSDKIREIVNGQNNFIQNSIEEDKNSLKVTAEDNERKFYSPDELEELETDIEASEDDSDNLKDPFDPEKISIDTRRVPMETVLRRLSQKTLILNPDFQRNEVWDDIQKSRLIESLMLKIPLPMFYIAADEKNNWTVVDGLQRISTFRDFVLGKNYLSTEDNDLKGKGFKLSGLEFWKDFENKQMNDLPTNLYNRILETEFSFTIINPGTSEEVKRNIFKRINTGGKPLSPQEIRNALYNGPSTRLLNKLSETTQFKNATDHSIQAKRMEDRELVLRCIAFLIRPFDSYKKTQNIDSWLSDTMIIINAFPHFNTREFLKLENTGKVSRNNLEIYNVEEIISKFLRSMERARKLFGRHAFRKSWEGIRRRPINKSLFETWGVILANLSEHDFNLLINHKSDFMEDYKKLLQDEKFQLYISRDSWKNYSVVSRFELLSSLVKNFTNQYA